MIDYHGKDSCKHCSRFKRPLFSLLYSVLICCCVLPCPPQTTAVCHAMLNTGLDKVSNAAEEWDPHCGLSPGCASAADSIAQWALNSRMAGGAEHNRGRSLSLSLSLSLCVCVCVHVHTYTCVCMCTHMHTFKYVFVCAQAHACACVYMCVHVCTCVCMSVCVCVECVWMHVYACGDVCVCVWMCVCVWGGVSLSRCSKMILSFIIHVDSVQAHHNNDSTAYRWRLKVLQKPNFTPKGSGHGAEAGNSPPPLPPDNSGGLLAKSPLLHHLWGRNKEGAFWEWWSETHICADWGWQQRLLNRTPSALYACRISYLV